MLFIWANWSASWFSLSEAVNSCIESFASCCWSAGVMTALSPCRRWWSVSRLGPPECWCSGRVEMIRLSICRHLNRAESPCRRRDDGYHADAEDGPPVPPSDCLSTCWLQPWTGPQTGWRRPQRQRSLSWCTDPGSPPHNPNAPYLQETRAAQIRWQNIRKPWLLFKLLQKSDWLKFSLF